MRGVIKNNLLFTITIWFPAADIVNVNADFQQELAPASTAKSINSGLIPRIPLCLTGKRNCLT